MTWFPIYHQMHLNNQMPLKFLSATSFLLYGVYALFSHGGDNNRVFERLKQEEIDHKEMSRWSATLSDPMSPNYNPFSLSKITFGLYQK
jgi:hypothetical protein